MSFINKGRQGETAREGGKEREKGKKREKSGDEARRRERSTKRQEKRAKKAKETIELFMPVARRLGNAKLCEELNASEIVAVHQV